MNVPEISAMTASSNNDLISALYAVTLSPEDFFKTYDDLDAVLFAGDAALPVPDTDASGSALALTPEAMHHISIARSIQERIARARTPDQKIERMLESVPNPSVLINRGEAVIAANGLARSAGIGATLAACVSDDDVLRQVRTFLARGNPANMLAVAGQTIARNAQTSVLVKRVDPGLLDGGGEPLFLLSIIDFGFDADAVDLFRATYGLTQAETQVAVLLASGLRLADIVIERHVTIDTVRTQIKIIKGKTGARDIPGLVRLLCGFTAGVKASMSGLAPSSPPETQRTAPLKARRRAVLRDGRRIEYVEQGAANGTPVLLFHNLPYGVELPEAAIRQANLDNLRFIAPVRPGYGASDPLDEADDDAYLDMVADDCLDLLRQLGVHRCVVLSHTMGAVFALRFACRYPERVTRLVGVGRPPVWRAKWLEQTPRRQRFILRLSMYCRPLLPVAAWGIIACLDSRYADDFIIRACDHSAADRKAVANREILDLIARGSLDAMRDSVDGFCRDCVVTLGDFTDDARRLPHKFHLLHGDDDGIVPLEQSLAFARDVPGTTVDIVPGAGQMLFFTHWERVFDAVAGKTRQKAGGLDYVDAATI